ncbi:MAG: protein-tyrosine kinase [Pirellulaceae bacterium]|jgi:protein-tyrosine kinase
MNQEQAGSTAVAEEQTVARTTTTQKPNREIDEQSLTLARSLLSNRTLHGNPAVGFTSCSPGEGVSTIAANVASAAATICDEPVLLIDANPKQPAIAKRFRCQQGPGWFDILDGTDNPKDCIQQTEITNLFVLPAGKSRGRATKSFNVEVVAQLIAQVKSRFGLVILDLPTATDKSETYSLAGELDGVILVIEAERVRNKVAQRIKDLLERAGGNVVGAVLNKRQEYIPNWLYNRL